MNKRRAYQQGPNGKVVKNGDVDEIRVKKKNVCQWSCAETQEIPVSGARRCHVDVNISEN